MAQVIYRVSGRDGSNHRITKKLRDTDEGKAAAKAFAATLKDATTVYDGRTRIDGRVVTRSFRRRKDLDAWITTTEADKIRGVAVDPRKAKVTFRDYANGWLAKRSTLALRTVETYRYLLDGYLLPTFGDRSLGGINPSDVRAWHAGVAAEHSVTAAKAYRLLRSILNTAVTDEIIARNPCRVKGAGVEKSTERPMASVAEVQALADAVPAYLRAMVLLAAWCQLRRGELLGLRRRDVDVLHGTLTVDVTRVVGIHGNAFQKDPKTVAGKRTLAVPENVLPDLRRHLDTYVGPYPDDPVAVGEGGGVLSPGVLQKAWERARTKVGRPDLRLHDLRHAGLTWSATAGATTAELMRRAGHASPQAALRYQHATEDRDRALAAALAGLAPNAEVVAIKDARKQAEADDGG
ncbi:MAG: site-specific integrase [Acidimicrobiales bacterium]